MSSSRSSVSRPKDAIGSLCHLMNLNGISGLTPEVFRQAKFNKPEAVAPLWSLLISLTHYAAHKHIPSDSDNSLRQSTQNTAIALTKHAMWVEGYWSFRFRQLPTDMSRGSRELLLACGWLLAKTNILADLMGDDGMHTADTAPLHTEEVLQLRMQKDEVRRTKDIRTDVRRGSHSMKYLAWLVGKCRMKARRLYIQQQELYNLTHQIHVATHGVSVTMDSPHLSPAETFLLRHAEQLVKYQQELEAKQARLHVGLKWQEQQATFWQWMESVLDAKLQDSSGEEETLIDDIIPSPTYRTGDLADLLEELEGHIRLLENVVEDTQEDSDFDKGDKAERLRIVEDVKTELIPLSSSPASSSSRRDGWHQSGRFHLNKKQPKSTGLQSTHRKHPNAAPIQEEIGRLSDALSELERELTELRSSHHFRMDELASVLPDAVCIPPMGSAR